jgi:spermidine/putrescine-binding protein
LVLLLDEIDKIIAQGMMENLGDALRSIISTSDISSRVRLVIAGSRRLFDIVTTGSPFLNILRKHHLSLFDKSEIKELANKSDKFSDNVVSAVWKHSGGHPLLAQYLFYHLWESDKRAIDEKLVDKFAWNFQHDCLDDIEGWAMALGESGLFTYRILAATDGWMSEADIAKLAADPKLNVNRALVNLCCHGLVSHESWQRYRCGGLIFKNWFDTNGTTFMHTMISLTTKPNIIVETKSSDENLSSQQKDLQKEGKPEKIVVLFSYTIAVLLIALVIALIIAKIIPNDQFIPFLIIFIVVIGAILVGVDKLTGAQFLKLIDTIISKIIK